MTTRDFASKMQTSIHLLTAILLSTALLSDCSGGNEATSPPQADATATATSSQLKLGASGATTGLIGGIDMEINLPADVSVDADPATGETAPGAVAISGAAAEGSSGLLAAKYSPMAGDAPATLHIIVINAAGFIPGEIVTIRYNLSSAASVPAASDFIITKFTALGPDGSVLSGITAAPLPVDAAGKAAEKALVTVTGTPLPELTMTVDTPTRLIAQTITGTLTPGFILTVTAPPPAVVGALTIAGINWSAPVSGLVPGPNTITATARSGGTIITATVDIVVDLIPPFINIDTVLGTRVDSQGISGSAEIGSTITVVCDFATADVVFFDDPGANITRWSAVVIGLVSGDNVCKVTATDGAGNTTTVDAHIFFDNIPPDLDIHVITPVKFNAVQTIFGTVKSGVTPTVTVINTSAVVSAMTVTGTDWSCQVSGLQAGDNIIMVTAKDQLGNVISKTATISVVVPNGSFSGALQPTVADALKALRIAVGLDVPTAADLVRCDIFDDGLNVIDVADAILILKKAVGIFDGLSLNNLLPQLLSSPGR